MDGGFEDTEVSHVEEAQEIDDLTAGIRRSRGAEAAGVNARFRHILEKYQEQSQLLDPHLPLVISRLSAVLQQQAHLPVKDQDRGSVTAVCRLLWITASVRGPGVVLKLFPNEARDLEPITCLLHDLDTPEPGEPVRGVWEATCVLLLWLAQLVLVPFSLRLLDSSLGSGKPGEEPPVPPLVGGLLQLCQGKLGAPGKERDMAALLLGRLLPRPDMPEALRSFLSWSRTAVDAARPEAAFLTPGVTATLAEVYKQGGRPQLLAIAPQVWQLLLGLLDSEAARNSVTSRKLAVKLLQRLGLAYLPPRATRWRYTTSATSLEASLGPGMPKESAVQPEESGDEDDEVDVSEEVEEVLGKLLEALGDKDTVVRWSAAKGVSRLTARLPKELGDEVAGSVLAVFGSPGAGEASWHGGCLALAELARRGLLLPARLPEAAAVVRQGLLYDVRRGMNSVGANVRDAAAYVCWACARAYEPALLRATLLQLAPTLLVAACCDREVNCRRAAAAAFQEAVGRQDSYPHGIDILTAADYFSLSTRTQAYLSVAPTIAAFPEHFHPLLDHLLLAKLRHWERSLRQLASRGLAALLPINPPHFVGSCIPTLLHLSLEPSLEVHHGAVLGLAEVILALHTLNQQQQQQQQLTEDQISSIAELPSKLHAAMYLKGKGGEVMKAAISRLVECMALASIPLSESQQKLVHDTIDDCLAASSEEIRAAAVAALRAFSRSYLLPQLAVQSSASSANGNTRHSFIIPAAGSAAPSNGATASGGQAVLQRSVQKYAAGVQLVGQLAAVRSSYAAALGCLPRGLLVPHQAEVLSVLGAAIQVEEDAGSRDAAARAAAATALSDVAQEVLSPQSVSQAEIMIQQVESSSEAVRVLMERVAQPLMVGMADYSTDNRGDVGSWVREAAMRALTHTLLLLLSVVRPGDSPHVQPGDTSVVQPDDSQHVQRWMVAVTCVLIKQAVERIGRVREAAAVCLRQLLTAAPPLPGIPARALLQRLILQAPTEGFASGEALPGMVELLGEEATREALLEGLIASIGGLDGSLAHASSSSLIAWLKADDSGEAARRLRSVITALLAIWSRNVTSARLAVPLLKTLDLLLSQGGLDTLPGPHVGALLAAVVQGTQGCRDVARLCTAAGVLTQMAVLPHNDSAPIQALQAVLKTLTCTFPRVRKHAAEQLYMALLAADPSEPPFNVESQAADLEAASAILADTAWDGPLAAAKEASRQLHGSLGCAPA